MKSLSKRTSLIGASVGLVILAAAGALISTTSNNRAKADAAAPPPATPVSVADVKERETAIWDEFSGRLEAVEQVEVRSRVAGAIQEIRFREGALVQKDDILVVIDPALYAAEVARAEAQVAAAQSRLVFTKSDYERGQQLTGSNTISQRDQDNRINAYREAEANLKAAQATLKTAQLNLGYTEVRAPVTGRVGKREITVGNLIAAGPGSPLLTTIVSTSPIYASFNADEQVVLRALDALGKDDAASKTGRIPVKMGTATSNGLPFEGQMQLIDNQVDARSGTVRVRAIFDNKDGRLIPGQFVRLQMGQPKTERAMMINERAVGTDQNKKYVMVVNKENKAEYREVSLGVAVDGLRVVTAGLKPGEQIVVKGMQRIRPGAPVAPEVIAMDAN
ncbi:MAG: multidrug efflux system membrane fusion protein [Afipia broomeae]|jgi:multidrug efflux system membrane fusion protein|uniref:Efflux transporter, RND family, MFP subunit n=1 Tax=Afipia broomeae ATCC 49717 TaxID=883078 RepID=K8PJW6_9BRAD|nr:MULTISPECIES: efflux RND transporter periplasmic adaptor subunit [Afipia]MAH72073.1 MexE family multidrug efflux RND transporter periplasmic adaptor subunit [Afipia sp.]OUX58690.1 MAG: MexE family multidrug efflux RND transporter periplasmic adaptor subunit [Afipia sp. TMED4]RTL79941.1 MAG: efflux RND transporter periplasmic adaptor subunit [Bradyrhizobiaceae bacterium]EKS41841.1 efflux transporter, RND family, MFP subunit [Afipia broomeae ATCC 49717]HAO41039.1 MexE family multidrug efflux 